MMMGHCKTGQSYFSYITCEKILYSENNLYSNISVNFDKYLHQLSISTKGCMRQTLCIFELV